MTPKCFIMDVDGVLTDGSFYYTAEGKVMKKFGADDNDALSLLLCLASSQLQNQNMNKLITDAKTGLQKTVHGFGHSVIRGLVTVGQWSAEDPAIYERESALYNVVNTASTQIIRTVPSEAPSLRLFS